MDKIADQFAYIRKRAEEIRMVEELGIYGTPPPSKVVGERKYPLLKHWDRTGSKSRPEGWYCEDVTKRVFDESDHERLSMAFQWSKTPQATEFWHRATKTGLRMEHLEALAEMIAEMKMVPK